MRAVYPGGARRSKEKPLAPAHQKKFDETYSSIFPYSEILELPHGSWVLQDSPFKKRKALLLHLALWKQVQSLVEARGTKKNTRTQETS